jgi:hypothetical protein
MCFMFCFRFVVVEPLAGARANLLDPVVLIDRQCECLSRTEARSFASLRMTSGPHQLAEQ